MKKLFVLGLVLAVLFVWLQWNQPQKQPASSANENIEKVSTGLNLTRYIEYSPTVLANTSDKRRILFFYANWCPKCRPVDNELNLNQEKIPEDVVIIRVNYNDSDTDNAEEQLAKKYAITYQHTFVQIDANENEVAKWVGGDLDQILQNVKAAVTSKRASFAIFTEGTFRVFTATMYHNLSKNAYIDASEPNIVKIDTQGVTWDDFFKTLPFELTRECLTTGTKETFCSGNSGVLRFYLNGNESDDVLSSEIQNGDRLLVSFGNETDSQIAQQMQKIPDPLYTKN